MFGYFYILKIQASCLYLFYNKLIFSTILDTNKARTRNRTEMRKMRKRIDECVALLASKYKIVVTEKEIESGMFSWIQVNGSMTDLQYVLKLHVNLITYIFLQNGF